MITNAEAEAWKATDEILSKLRRSQYSDERHFRGAIFSAIYHAVLREREECIKLAESFGSNGTHLVKAIRERTPHKEKGEPAPGGWKAGTM